MNQNSIGMDGGLIASWMNENSSIAKEYVEDRYMFQAQNWKEKRVYFNYAGGYKKNPERESFFGHSVAYVDLSDGKMHIASDMRGMRKIAKSAAEKFGIEVVQ